MELIDGAPWFDYIHDKDIAYDVLTVVDLMSDVSDAMQYLHGKEIMHRDLKSLNILVDCYLKHAHLIDFGFSKSKEQNNLRNTANAGTVSWMAPEMVMSPFIYDESVDVYSFSVVLWESLTRSTPFEELEGQGFIGVINAVVKGVRPIMPEVIDAPIKSLIESCWDGDRQLRPSFAKIHATLTSTEVRNTLDLHRTIPWVNCLYCKK
jgi:serine/threonine protein kinase